MDFQSLLQYCVILVTFPSPFYTCVCISGCVECLVHHQSFSICPPPGLQRPLFPFLPASFSFVLETTMVSTESRSWFCCFVYECFANSFAQVIHRPYMSETIWLLISLPDSFDCIHTSITSHPWHPKGHIPWTYTLFLKHGYFSAGLIPVSNNLIIIFIPSGDHMSNM